VVLTIEFRVDPQRAEEFCALMWAQSRPSRLRQGAMSWELQRDMDEPGRFVEVVTDESWADHLRRFERVTVADAQLRDRKRAFHVGEAEPVIRRYVTTARRHCVCAAE
jgi:quinol monooxygenase YgiN